MPAEEGCRVELRADDALERLGDVYVRERSAVVGCARRAVQDPDSVEDAIHDGFLRVISFIRREGSRQVTTPERLVTRNVRWAALNLRSSRRRLCELPEHAAFHESFDAADARVTCDQLLGSLRSRHRNVLVLRFYHQLPDEQAAALLGITVKAYRRRLDRALLMSRTLLAVSSASALVTAVAGRIKRVATSVGQRVGLRAGTSAWAQDPFGPVATMAMVGLAVLVASGTAASLPERGSSPVSSALNVAPASNVVVWAKRAGEASRDAPATSHSSSAQPGQPPTPVPARVPLSLPTGAASETPEDSFFESAAVAPGDPTGRTIVALGQGTACHCSVLFRSVDGGGTWSAAASPAMADQIALPPAYPQDPRIFLGSEPAGGLDFVAAAFGSMWVPLSAPPGHIAVSSGFDHGDPRVFVTTTGGVVAENIVNGQLTPVAVDADAQANDLVAAAPSGSDAAVYIVYHVPSLLSGSGAPPPEPTLFRCTVSSACLDVGIVPLVTPDELIATRARSGTETVIVRSPQGLAIWTRSGWTTIGSPSGSPSAGMNLVTVAGNPALSSVIGTLGQHGASLNLLPLGGSWGSFAVADPQVGMLVELDSQRFLLLRQAGGLRCTVDDGRTWAARCPSLG
jgi:RNA polymerase sigma factor (sigma-70 family)